MSVFRSESTAKIALHQGAGGGGSRRVLATERSGTRTHPVASRRGALNLKRLRASIPDSWIAAGVENGSNVDQSLANAIDKRERIMPYDGNSEFIIDTRRGQGIPADTINRVLNVAETIGLQTRLVRAEPFHGVSQVRLRSIEESDRVTHPLG
jgi:hypothetical protein